MLMTVNDAYLWALKEEKPELAADCLARVAYYGMRGKECNNALFTQGFEELGARRIIEVFSKTVEHRPPYPVIDLATALLEDLVDRGEEPKNELWDGEKWV